MGNRAIFVLILLVLLQLSMNGVIQQVSAVSYRDITVTGNGQIWNEGTGGNNDIASDSVNILIESDVNLNSMQCRLERADGSVVENFVTCSDTPTTGHKAYPNLNGEYTFTLKVADSSIGSNASTLHYEFDTFGSGGPSFSAAPDVNAQSTPQSLVEKCDTPYPYITTAMYTMNAIAEPVNNNTVQDKIQISFYRDLTSGNLTGRIISGYNRAWFEEGSVRTSTDCINDLVDIQNFKVKPGYASYNPPFADCIGNPRAVSYLVDANIEKGLNFTNGTNMEITIKINNDFSGKLSGTLSAFQLDPFYYEVLDLNATGLPTTTCFGSEMR